MKIIKPLLITAFVAAVLLLNPKTVQLIGNLIGKSTHQLTETAKFSYGNTSNMKIMGFQNGIVIYNGRKMSLLDKKGQKQGESELRSNDYDMTVQNGRILFLDKVKRNLAVIEKNGKISSQIKFAEKPVFVEAIGKDRFVVHYVYDMNEKAEGLRIFNMSGKQIKDIQISNISINFISPDERGQGFLVSGLTVDKERLYNTMMHYNVNGDMETADKAENRVFVGGMLIDDRFVLWEEGYVELRDAELKYINSLRVESGIVQLKSEEGGFTVLDSSSSIRDFNLEGAEEKQEKYAHRIYGVIEVSGKDILLSQRSIEIMGTKESMDFTNDIIDTIKIGDDCLGLVFRGEIRIIAVD